jgi:hypothetical protein
VIMQHGRSTTLDDSSLAFGAAWKVLDLLLELAYANAGTTAASGRLTIAKKESLARQGHGTLAPLTTDRTLWRTLILQPHLPFATVVVCAPCSGLMASAPPGPGQHEAWLDRCSPHQRHQQPADLGNRQREQTEPAVQAAVSPFARSGLVAWARVTARNAWASSARVMWRYQPGHLRTS